MKIFPIASYRLWLLGVGILAFVVLLSTDTVLRSTTCPTQFYSGCEHYTDVLFGFNSGFFLKSIIITTLILMALPERAFKWWRWFAVVAISFMSWEIYTTETHGSGLFMGLSSSPRLTSDLAGALFLSLSAAIATLSILCGKINNHHFSKPLHRYGAYLGACAFSLLIGILLLPGTLWALN